MGANYKDINSNLNTINQDLVIDTNLKAIENSIRNIVSTRKGELPGNPEFGTNISDVLFEFKGEIAYNLIRTMLIEELDEQEPRIIVEDILFNTDEESSVVLVTIVYRVIFLDDIIANTTIEVSI